MPIRRNTTNLKISLIAIRQSVPVAGSRVSKTSGIRVAGQLTSYCDSNIERDKPSVVGFCMDLLLRLAAGAEKFARTMSIATTPSGSVHGNGKQARKGEFT
jgi:hypothetical protein